MSEAPILINQTAFLGDVLLTVPLLRRLRELFPQNPLWLVARRGVGQPLLATKTIDRLFEVTKGDWSSYVAVQNQVRSENFKFIFSPHQSFTSARFLWPLKADQKISYSRWWNGLFYNYRLPRDWDLPEALRLLQMLAHLDPKTSARIQDYLKHHPRGSVNAIPEWSSMDLSSAWTAVSVKTDLPSKYVVMFPGSTWSTKQWTTEGYVQLTRKILNDGVSVVLLGSKEERALCDQIRLQVGAPDKVFSLAGQTSLLESIEIVRQASMVVGNDSAGQHMAALMGRPVVAVFGPTTTQFGFRPWISECRIIEHKNLECRPCGVHGHRECPAGHHRCMKDVSAETVYTAVKTLTQI